MRHVCAGFAMLALAWAAPAAAQAQTTPMTMPATDTLGWVGVLAAAGSVVNSGGAFGLEAGTHLRKNIDVFIEGAHFTDVVTRTRLDMASTIGTYLQTTQGTTATAIVKAPAWYGGLGVRYTPDVDWTVKPYGLFAVGAARVDYKPVFTVGGTDVTSNIAAYGVTVGSDLQSTVTKPAFTYGIGATYWIGRLYVDGSIRFTTIKTTGQSTNVTRGGVGVGLKF